MPLRLHQIEYLKATEAVGNLVRNNIIIRLQRLLQRVLVSIQKN